MNNPFPLLRNCQKKGTEMISLSYDDDYIYSKSKSIIKLRTDLANIDVKRILTLS